MKHHVTIYWTCSRVAKVKIMSRFGIQDYTNVGGETEAWITDDDWDLFCQTRDKRFFYSAQQTINDIISQKHFPRTTCLIEYQFNK